MTHNPKTEALELLKRSDAYSLPVNLEAVAKHLDIRILYEDFEDNISGLLVVKNGKRAIGVNRSHHSNRQRFTIAHEIGHFVLHHKFEDPKNDIHIEKKWSYFRSTTQSKNDNEKVNRQEYEANQFSAELLMPKELVVQQIAKFKLNMSDDSDVSRLAMMLQVSEKALTIRLISLKIGQPY